MPLSDRELDDLFPVLFPKAPDEDRKLVNPASVDIRIGTDAWVEKPGRVPGWEPHSLAGYSEEKPFLVDPGAFLLTSTWEWLHVPNGYALELKMKSSRAREGWNHTVAFWFDPGWDGIGTMEIKNETRYHQLPLWPGLRFAQVVVHRLSSLARNPYNGRYQGAATAQLARP
ncbi:MAG: hypothetical protein C4542_07435 [Dehalococcoidia bacterium]|nr:MAG: hypothetical protein C4542_07435 [Dehalococcoidia bacterium]